MQDTYEGLDTHAKSDLPCEGSFELDKCGGHKCNAEKDKAHFASGTVAPAVGKGAIAVRVVLLISRFRDQGCDKIGICRVNAARDKGAQPGALLNPVSHLHIDLERCETTGQLRPLSLWGTLMEDLKGAALT